jgi:probable F420-dependent oxidoreductase
MKFGVFIVPTDSSISVTSLAVELESRGFESLFLPEHTHIPVSTSSTYPGGRPGDPVPLEYRSVYEPYVALSAAAAVTKDLLVGTGVCLVAQHHPISLAKRAATLDQISQGRFLFGVGAGWNAEEMRNHGIDPARRTEALEESLMAIRSIWREDEASFAGKTINFGPIWSWPKPYGGSEPRILVGGRSARARALAAKMGGDWMPDDPRDSKALAKMVEEFREQVEQIGGQAAVSLFSARPHPEDLEVYEETGIARCIFWLPAVGRDELLPRLDRYAQLIA